MNLYEMKLGESFWSSEMDSSILRVPGGWLFRGWDQDRGVHTSITFVPFNNEFIKTSEQVESPATDKQQPQQANAIPQSDVIFGTEIDIGTGLIRLK
jgi:hypothetical protein